jgi:hypothetical protein
LLLLLRWLLSLHRAEHPQPLPQIRRLLLLLCGAGACCCCMVVTVNSNE